MTARYLRTTVFALALAITMMCSACTSPERPGPSEATPGPASTEVKGLLQNEPAELGGTSWQLVKFQGGDDTILSPDDRSKYTIAFGTDGRVSARIDCNRGSGSWKSAGPNQVEFGMMAITQAACLTPGPLPGRVTKDWQYVRSYVFKDGHLFLSLMADAGIYEYEPMTATASTPGRVTGTVNYLQRVALTPNAVVEVKLLDVSRADAAAITIAGQEIRPAGKQVPIPFEVTYDPAVINERGRYVIQARIFEGGVLRFASMDAYPVLTGGGANTVAVIVRPVGK
jgi:uncharacterized lipoprotein YbaY/heat shock protein HslJ